MSKTVYGGTSNMLRSFNKNKKADLSVYELQEYMKRNNRSEDLNEEDCKALFDGIDPLHKGSVPVLEFLRRAEESEYGISPENAELAKVRNFLRERVAQQREKTLTTLTNNTNDTNGTLSTESTDVNVRKHTHIIGMTPDDEAELLKMATGCRPFDLDINTDEFDASIKSIFSTR